MVEADIQLPTSKLLISGLGESRAAGTGRRKFAIGRRGGEDVAHLRLLGCGRTDHVQKSQRLPCRLTIP